MKKQYNEVNVSQAIDLSEGRKLNSEQQKQLNSLQKARAIHELSVGFAVSMIQGSCGEFNSKAVVNCANELATLCIEKTLELNESLK